MTRRLPAAPLVSAVEARGGFGSLWRQPSHTQETKRLRRAYDRARASGHVSVRYADELAVRLLGRHPALVWPEWAETA